MENLFAGKCHLTGPAIKGGCVTWHIHPGRVLILYPGNSPGAGLRQKV